MTSKSIKYVKDLFKNTVLSLKHVFIYKPSDRRYVEKKILAAGGWGYGNTGDEAQCSAALKLLKTRYKDYKIINLTPDVGYSAEMHPGYIHEYASRTLIFNQNRDCNCYDLGKSRFLKMIFLLKSFWVCFNAILVRSRLPVLFINADTAKFLYELNTAALFYFCGGGYLTGSTQSRLWDGILICICCHIFRVPVVMSGQTIGVWETWFNKIYAKYGLRHVRLITVRDEEFSLKDLKEIGLSGDNIFPTHDDALFCEKSSGKQINRDNYITVNFHYWGMKERQKEQCLSKIHDVIDFILNSTEHHLIFIPMHSSDKKSFEDYISRCPSERFTCFDYDYDFRKVRRVISESKLCVTMKHHPIIFAMGETVPVISLAFSKYYVHKNLGALMQYKQENCSIDLESDDYFEKFKTLFNYISDNYDNIRSTIIQRLEVLKERKEKFLNLTDEILET